MNLNGTLYKPGAAIVHDLGTEDDDMKVAIINKIYIINSDTTVFKAKHFTITRYKKHYRAHILALLPTFSFFTHDQLPLHTPIHPRRCRAFPQSLIVINFISSNFTYPLTSVLCIVLINSLLGSFLPALHPY